MTNCYLSLVACLALLVSESASSSAQNHPPKAEKITVTILALSISARTGYSGEEDTYLAAVITS